MKGQILLGAVTMNRVMVMTKIGTLLLAISAMPACTTLLGGKGKGKAVRDGANLERQVVVQQANSDTGILSDMGRDQWIQVRQSSKSNQMKVYAALGAREWSVAAQEARALLKKQPRDFAGLLALTTALAMQHDYQLANFYADQLEKYYPGRSEVMNVKALAALNRPKADMKDYKEAMALFRQAFDGNSNEVAAGLNLAQLYLETGEPAQAKETFQTTSSRCGACYQAEMGVGIAAGRLGQYDEARRAFSKVLDKSPNNPQALFRLALIEQTGFNNRKKAKSYLKQLLAEAPENAKELRRRANFLLRSIEANENAVKTEMAEEKTSPEMEEAALKGTMKPASETP